MRSYLQPYLPPVTVFCYVKPSKMNLQLLNALQVTQTLMSTTHPKLQFGAHGNRMCKMCIGTTAAAELRRHQTSHNSARYRIDLNPSLKSFPTISVSARPVHACPQAHMFDRAFPPQYRHVYSAASQFSE